MGALTLSDGPWSLCDECLPKREQRSHSAKWRENREGEPCEECGAIWHRPLTKPDGDGGAT